MSHLNEHPSLASLLWNRPVIELISVPFDIEWILGGMNAYKVDQMKVPCTLSTIIESPEVTAYIFKQKTPQNDTFSRRRAAAGVGSEGVGAVGVGSQGASHGVGARKARYLGEMLTRLIVPWVKMHSRWVKIHFDWVRMELLRV